MAIHATKMTLATLVILFSHQAALGATVCTHTGPLGQNTYSTDGNTGTYTWEDHGVNRSWPLTCGSQPDGTTVCHRWRAYGDRGRSVMIFQMQPDGVLIQAASWVLLDHSTVTLTPGFTCTTEPE